VKITFKTTALQTCYEQQAKAVKKWGVKVARAYVARVNVLHQVKKAQELAMFKHLRFHPLKGALKGRYAIDLTARYRLIVSFQGEQMTVVRVDEVSKHYGD